MRLLILTHARSGGLNLANWLWKELRLKLYHEPFNPESLIHPEVLIMDDIIVKDFIHHIEDRCPIGLNDFISTFDKVIVLTRENTYETAVSFVFMCSEERKGEWAHDKYTINDSWVEKHQSDIIFKQKQLHNEIEFLQRIPNSLQVTYEEIYENTDDIEKIYKYVGIKDSIHSDILSSKYRLRNGKIGMKYGDDFKHNKNKKLI